MKNIGIFGGTFDPIHNGHLHLAEQVLAHIDLAEIQFLPCANPVHRDEPHASGEHRIGMLQQAISGRSKFSINRVELDRSGPSFMADSLELISDQQPRSRLFLLVGVDAYNAFRSWKSPEQILNRAHLLVCRRPGSRFDRRIYPERLVNSAEQVLDIDAGAILPLEIEENACSSSEIRNRLKTGQNVESCLPKAVFDYIHQHHLYETNSE